MEFHEIVKSFDPLSNAERAGLKKSIEQHGCRMPVVVWENEGRQLGLDGRHRVEICEELGVEYELRIFHGTEEQAIALAESLNDDRRHRTPEKRQERIERVKAARLAGSSIRTISETEKVSISQVQRDLEDASGVPGGTPERESALKKRHSHGQRRQDIPQENVQATRAENDRQAAFRGQHGRGKGPARSACSNRSAAAIPQGSRLFGLHQAAQRDRDRAEGAFHVSCWRMPEAATT